METYIDKETVVEGASVGDGTRIGPFTYIGNATIGKNCEIKNNVSIPTGVTIEDNVFVGSNVTFSNTRKPRAGECPSALSAVGKIVVKHGACIGDGATIICGNEVFPVEIGENSTVGAGAVVTKNVPPGVTVVGNPSGILVKDVHGTAFTISYEQYYVKKIKR